MIVFVCVSVCVCFCMCVCCINKYMNLYVHVCGSVRRLAIHTCNFSTTLHFIVHSRSLIVILPSLDFACVANVSQISAYLCFHSTGILNISIMHSIFTWALRIKLGSYVYITGTSQIYLSISHTQNY